MFKLALTWNCASSYNQHLSNPHTFTLDTEHRPSLIQAWSRPDPGLTCLVLIVMEIGEMWDGGEGVQDHRGVVRTRTHTCNKQEEIPENVHACTDQLPHLPQSILSSPSHVSHWGNHLKCWRRAELKSERHLNLFTVIQSSEIWAEIVAADSIVI